MEENVQYNVFLWYVLYGNQIVIFTMKWYKTEKVFIICGFQIYC